MPSERAVPVFLIALLALGEGVMANGHELDCPDRPSCVSSRATEPARQIPALTHEGDAAGAMQRLAAIIERMPRATIVSVSSTSLHATFESRVFGFVDDLDLRAIDDGSIDVRSVSRVGYYDFGVNRARVEQIRTLFNG